MSPSLALPLHRWPRCTFTSRAGLRWTHPNHSDEMQIRIAVPALALALMAPIATSQGVEIQRRAASVAQDTSPAAKIFAEVNAVFRAEMANVKRPNRGASKEERAAYMAAFEKARAAQVAAAKKALETHAELLGKPGAARYRAQLQGTAGQHKAAMESFLAHAKETDSATERNDALVMAANLCRRYGAGASAAKKILDDVDADKLSPRMQRQHRQLATGLASDIKREALNGKPAPEINVLHVLGKTAGEEGDAFSLSQYSGKVVLIDFWATWCGPCRAVIPGLVEMQKKYGSEIQILGATRFYGYGSDFSDPKATLPHGGKTVRDLDEEAELEINRVFAERFGLNYPILISDNNAGKSYAVRGIPTVFVIDQHGKIVDSVVGSGEANHTKLVNTVERLLGRKGAEGNADEASHGKKTKHD